MDKRLLKLWSEMYTELDKPTVMVGGQKPFIIHLPHLADCLEKFSFGGRRIRAFWLLTKLQNISVDEILAHIKTHAN